MKKQIILTAVIASLALSMSAKKNDKKDASAPECAQKEQCCKDKKDMKGVCPFEGLNLSDKQKEELKKIDERRKADFDKKRKEKADSKKEAKRVEREAKVAEMKECKKAYLDKVKAVLSAEQYVQFLENYYINAPKKMKAPKEFKKGDRPEKGSRPPFRPDGQRRLRPVNATPTLVGEDK